MNPKKTIEYVTPDGEIIKGSIAEVAKQARVSPKTIYKFLDAQGKVEGKVQPKREKLGKVEKHREKLKPWATIPANTLKPGDEIIVTATIQSQPDYAALQQEHTAQMLEKPREHQKKILPRNPCVLCGKPTYCTKILNKDLPNEETIHICFASCNTPPVNHERKEPNQAQLDYIKKFIAQNTKLAGNVKIATQIDAK